jgi:rhomboid family protein
MFCGHRGKTAEVKPGSRPGVFLFIPIKDNNPLKVIRFAYVNWALILISVFIFAILQGGLFSSSNANVAYGVIPAIFFNTARLDPSLATLPVELTLITYMFLHGGWMHLITNMLFLWVFGDNIEDAVGHFGYLVFYLLCGVIAGLAHAWALPSSSAPLVGASGAIAGVMGAYFLLYPKVRVWILLFWRIPLPVPAVIALGLWISLQVFNAFISSQESIAWWAHIGGFFTGAILIVFMRRQSFRLLDMT